MMIPTIPTSAEVTLLIKEVFTECLMSLTTGIGALCIVIYLLSLMAMTMELSGEECKSKKYTIGSLIVYFLSKTIQFLFI